MKRKLSIRMLVLFTCLCLFTGVVFAQGKNADKKTPPTAASKDATKSEKASTATIDINSASKQELMTLPGVGDVTAQKIIDNRPYRGKNDLVRKNIVNQATYDKISGLIIAKQNAGKTEKKTTE